MKRAFVMLAAAGAVLATAGTASADPIPALSVNPGDVFAADAGFFFTAARLHHRRQTAHDRKRSAT
jgi:hypothetical protein